jgi:hypothetical protein
MSASLAELFDSGDDWALCREVCVRIEEAHDDLLTLSEEERVVYLVISAHGIIGNGGFQYLFEHCPDLDPYFALTQKAFDAIGCWEASAALRRSLTLFPSSRPPKNTDKRVRMYRKRIKTWPTPEDELYFKAMEDVEHCLANFIRGRRRAFMHLT